MRRPALRLALAGWLCLGAPISNVSSAFSLSRTALRRPAACQRQSSTNPVDDDELSKLIGKRDQIKRKKKIIPEEDVERMNLDAPPSAADQIDFDSMPSFKTQRPVRRPSKDKEADTKKKGKEKESQNGLDFLAEFEDENDLHIPNRIGVSTMKWGDPTQGFVSSGKLTKKQRRQGKFVPGDVQLAYNTLLESGISFLETSELYGVSSRAQQLSAEHILGRCMEENDAFSPIVAGTYANAWKNVLKNRSVRLGGKAVRNAIENSCTRMDASGVELYKVESTFLYPGGRGALADGLGMAIDKGYCNYIGVQNVGARGMRGLARKLEQRGLTLTTNQFEFSLTNRKALKSGLIDACKDLGVIPLVQAPLDGGLASGKYTATNPSGGEAGGAARYPFSKLEKLQPLHSVQETVAERASTRVARELRDVKERMRRTGPTPKINTDITTTQVAINYIIAKGAVPLCDVVDSKQAAEVLGCLGWSLSEDEIDMLDSAASLCGL